MKMFRLCLLFSMLFSATILSAQPEVFLPDQAQVQQQIQFQQQSIQSADVLSNRDKLSDVSLANSSENPEFVTRQQTDKKSSLSTIKTLVPYEDLYKVLQKDIGKYFIIPITEFEALKQAKKPGWRQKLRRLKRPRFCTISIQPASKDVWKIILPT